MHLEGNYTFAAPREAVWDAIMDPEVMGSAMPGGEKLDRISEDEYRGVMNVRIGPVQGKFQGKIILSEVNRPESCTMTVDGRGAAGFLSGTGSWKLMEEGGSTVMHYQGDVDVGGKIANVGQRLIESSAKSLTRQGLKALDAQIQARLAPTPALPAGGDEAKAAPAAPPPPRPAPAGPSMTGIALETAKDVAKDLAADVIPADQQTNVLYFLLGALSMLLFVVLVRLVQK